MSSRTPSCWSPPHHVSSVLCFRAVSKSNKESKGLKIWSAFGMLNNESCHNFHRFFNHAWWYRQVSFSCQLYKGLYIAGIFMCRIYSTRTKWRHSLASRSPCSKFNKQHPFDWDNRVVISPNRIRNTLKCSIKSPVQYIDLHQVRWR